MEPSTLYSDPKAKPKPPAIWLLITLVAGAAGALSAVAVGGRGSYEVRPFTVELSARPAIAGKTEVAVVPAEPALRELTPRGHAEAGTHAGPLVARITITGLATDTRLAASDAEVFADPAAAAAFMSSDGKAAVQSFTIKCALLAIAGGAAAGIAIGLRRPRRIVGAAISGLLTFAVIGVMVQQTYDAAEFTKTRYVFERPQGGPADPLDVPTP